MIEIDGDRAFCNTCSHDWSAAPVRKFASLDDLIRRSGLPSSSVSVALLGLEMKRLIRQLPGKLFVRNN